MKHIGIVAALPGELAPLVLGWERRGPVWREQWEQGGEQPLRAYAACAGMGSAAATQAFAMVASAAERDGQRLEAVISYGWAGAISCGVKPPQVLVVGEVIDARTGERFATDGAAGSTPAGAPLRLVTLDHVARPREKRALAERYGAVLVDMEAATIGRLARAQGLDFLCIKAISDGYTDELPDFNPFLDAHGQLRMAAFVAHALLRPASWSALWRLHVQSKAAARNLASAFPLCLQQPTLVS